MSLRFKRHYKLIVMLVLVSVVLVSGFGDRRIVAYTVDDSSLSAGGAASQMVEAGTTGTAAVAHSSDSDAVLSDDTGVPTIPILSYEAN